MTTTPSAASAPSSRMNPTTRPMSLIVLDRSGDEDELSLLDDPSSDDPPPPADPPPDEDGGGVTAGGE